MADKSKDQGGGRDVKRPPTIRQPRIGAETVGGGTAIGGSVTGGSVDADAASAIDDESGRSKTPASRRNEPAIGAPKDASASKATLGPGSGRGAAHSEPSKPVGPRPEPRAPERPAGIPALSAERLDLVRHGRDSVLSLLVNENLVAAWCRNPPEYDEARVRFLAQRKDLQRLSGMPGALQDPVNRFMNSPAWSTLTKAFASSKAYGAGFVNGVCADELKRRFGKVREAIEIAFADDGFLDFNERAGIDRLAASLRVLPNECDDLVLEVQQERLSRDEKAEIQKARPLVARRADDPAPPVDSWPAMLRLAEDRKTRAVALRDLCSTIESGVLAHWFDVQRSPKSLTDAAEAATAVAMGTPPGSEHRLHVERAAWRVLWTGGFQVFDLAWRGVDEKPGRKREVRSLAALKKRVRTKGPRDLEQALQRGLLVPWLSSLDEADEISSLIDLADEAERAVWDGGVGSGAARAATQTLALALGAKRGGAAAREAVVPDSDDREEAALRRQRVDALSRVAGALFDPGGTLTFAGQAELWRRAASDGLTLLEADDAARGAQKERRRRGVKAEIQEAPPLRARKPGDKAPTAKRFVDLVRAVQGGDHRREAIGDLADGLGRGALVFWLSAQNLPGTVIDEASKAEELARLETSAASRSRVLEQRAWWLAWVGGTRVIDLAWPGLTSVAYKAEDVDSVAALRRAAQGGPTKLHPVLRAGILSLWLRSRRDQDTTDLMVEMAERAERLENERSAKPVEVSIAVMRLIWAIGLTTIRLGEREVADRDAFLRLEPNDRHVQRFASEGYLEAWIEDVLGQPAVAAALKESRSHSLSGRLLVLEAQWRLGRRDSKRDAFAAPTPDRRSILDAALTSLAAFLAFGEACRDELQLWVAIAPGGTDVSREVLARIAEIADVHKTPLAIAYAALKAFGFPGFPVFGPDEKDSAPTILTSAESLAERAHERWASIDRPEVLAPLSAWLGTKSPAASQRLVSFAPGEAHVSWDLHDLLAAAGDVTIRHADGRPLGLTDGRRFGALRIGLTAKDVMRAVAAWAAEDDAVPEELSSLFAAGMLQTWLALNDAQLAAGLHERTKNLPRDVDRLTAYLWAFGDDRLALTDELTVESVEELIAHARDHLDAIETLLDNGMLEAWVPEAYKTPLARLVSEVTAARREVRGRTPTPPEWWQQGGQRVAAAWSRPHAWLTVVNRAALAVRALGGRCDALMPVVNHVTVERMPADSDLDLELRFQTQPGDVPTLGLVVDEDGTPMALPVATWDDQTVVHLEAGGLRPAPSTTKLAAKIINPGEESRPVSFGVTTTFPHRRFKRALRSGVVSFAARHLIALMIGAVLFGAAGHAFHAAGDGFAFAGTFAAVLGLLVVGGLPPLLARLGSAWRDRGGDAFEPHLRMAFIASLGAVVVAAIIGLIFMASYADRAWEPLVTRIGSVSSYLFDPDHMTWFTFGFVGSVICLTVLLATGTLTVALWRGRFRRLALLTTAAGWLTLASLVA